MRLACPLVAAITLLGCTPRSTTPPAESARVTHGIAAGAVSPTAAIVWGRCDRPTSMSVRWRALPDDAAQTARTMVTAEHDLVGKIALAGLRPQTPYSYTLWCGDDESTARLGSFKTAPDSKHAASVQFAFGGDLGGQNACRDRHRGYPIFDTIRQRDPDFFIALGDLIYADDPCTAAGRFGNQQIPGPPAAAVSLADFHAYWRYNREDAGFQALLAAMSMYSVWDDHEIKNDAGPRHDTLPAKPGEHLLGPALRAYLDYQPMLPPAVAPLQLYGSARWGRHVELFILDLRQHRDANFARDSAASPKTMLGDEQRRWLLEALRRSDATWKIIVSSVPLSVPTGAAPAGHDGWSGLGEGDGFEAEREMIVRAMQASTPRNYVWLTTDVHFGAVFRYRPFADDPRFIFHEIISGPLNAGVFLKEEFDRTLGTERLFLYGPRGAIADYDEALSWFNFGLVDIGPDGNLSAALINGNGDSVYEMMLAPR